MNNNILTSAEKEVLQARLDAEKKVLNRLEKYYKEALDEIGEKIAAMLGRQDADLPNVINRIEYQRLLKGQVQSALDKLHSNEYETIEKYLKDSYTDAFVGAMYSLHDQGIPIIIPIDQNTAIKAVTVDTRLSKPLYASLGVDIQHLKTNISAEITRGIAASRTYSEMARNLAAVSRIPLGRARTIVRTEAGRIQEQAIMDSAEQSKKKGADVVKQWCAILDMKTRDSHRRLDMQIRELEEYFELGSLKAKHPGDFGDPAEDCNCRCTTLIRARAALDADELEELKARAEYFGLDKSDSFEEFKKKYLKGAENPKEYNMVRASKLEANGLFVNRTEKLHRYAKKIPPIDGFEDFTCHADADKFYIDLGGLGKDEDFFELTPEEYAERIKASSSYKGGNIRIISCQAGAKKDGAAQRLANALNVDVYAPTETVHVTENGEIFISDNDILAEMWYNESDRNVIKETGTWRLFKPRKE